MFVCLQTQIQTESGLCLGFCLRTSRIWTSGLRPSDSTRNVSSKSLNDFPLAFSGTYIFEIDFTSSFTRERFRPKIRFIDLTKPNIFTRRWTPAFVRNEILYFFWKSAKCVNGNYPTLIRSSSVKDPSLTLAKTFPTECKSQIHFHSVSSIESHFQGAAFASINFSNSLHTPFAFFSLTARKIESLKYRSWFYFNFWKTESLFPWTPWWILLKIHETLLATLQYMFPLG